MAASCGTSPPEASRRPDVTPALGTTPVETPAPVEPEARPGALAWSRAETTAPPGEPVAATIVVRTPDGTTTAVADEAAYRAAPAWSPDGGSLAYLADGSLVVSAVGGAADPIFPCRPASCLGLGPPAWSPDGDAIAFGMFGADREGLAVIGLADPRPAIIAELVIDGAPAWSPDGRTIAVAVGGAIEILDASDGTSVRTVRVPGALGDRIAWSPDGRTFAVDGRAGGVAGVFLVPADGGEPSLLTRCPEPRCTDLDPAWSPDGAWVVFTRARCDQPGGDCFTGDLYIVRSGGGTARPLVRSPAPKCCAAWQPLPAG